MPREIVPVLATRETLNNMGERATRKMPGNGPREGVSLALSASTGGQVSNADGAGRCRASIKRIS